VQLGADRPDRAQSPAPGTALSAGWQRRRKPSTCRTDGAALLLRWGYRRVVYEQETLHPARRV